jgi:DNA repair protein RadD
MPPLKLRQYQIDDIERIRAEIRSDKKRVVYVLATGGGKTVISAEIIRSAVAKGSKVFFVAHRKELIDQTSNKLHDFGVRHGVMMANHPLRDPSAPVQVISIQTGIRRELPYKPHLVFVDECHRIAAESYKDFLLDCGDPVVVGITATPVRGDLQGLGGKIFQSMVVGPQMSSLIQQGFLVKPRVFSWKINLKGVRLLGGDYNQKQLEEKMIDTKLVGDVYREWVKRCSDRSTVVFATSIAHSKMILDDFLANGVAAEHIDTKTPKEDREAVLSRLASGYTQVVCNVGILTEGWDCPRVSAVCIVRPTRSESLYLQMAGRALRPWGDKTDCIVNDHGGVAQEFGTPDMDREWELDDTTISKPEKLDIRDKIKVCPKCAEVYDISVYTCICGYQFSKKPDDIKYGSGELHEIDYKIKREEKSKRKDYEWFLHQQHTMKKADGTPYSHGFAFAKYLSKYGEKPSWSWLKEWKKKNNVS